MSNYYMRQYRTKQVTLLYSLTTHFNDRSQNIARVPSLELPSEICGTLRLISWVNFWFKMVDEAHAIDFLCHPKSLEFLEKIFFKSTTEL